MLAMQEESESTVPKASTVLRGMSLGALAVHLGAELVGDADVIVTGVQQDSRLVEPGDLFVALVGARADGTRFITPACDAGATAVLVRRGTQLPAGVSGLCVDDTRTAMADAAAAVYDRPTAELTVVGITGTNGKTTTAQLARHALSALGARVGVVGTLGYAFEDMALDASHTSPEADALQRVARQMVDRGAEDLVMEVSSIALAAERVRGTEFDVGVFTNLTQDHLDWHGSMEAYTAEKDRLFLEHAPRVCVINVDDAHGAVLAERIVGRVVTVSLEGAPATVRAMRVEQTAAGIAMHVDVEGDQHVLRAPLIGLHNAANLLATVAIVHALGRDVAAAVDALRTAPMVPGRLERCDDPARDDIVVVVDYAHTPDALERALGSLRNVGEGALWCVFGCGGDRDRKKRRPMGEAVARGADVAIITNDNPRSEDPAAIAEEIAMGMAGAGHRVELDRRLAIAHAVGNAKPGDVVLVAGKGHETYQIIGDTVTDFDDREVVREALSRRRGA